MTVNAQASMPSDYLSGYMAPVPDEIEGLDLEIEGALPSELFGTYMRNGSNPPPGVDPGHDFTGQGMVHGVRLKDGRASWYRNRWVRTSAMKGARVRMPDGTVDLTAGVGNTSLIPFAGQVLALVENALPYAMTPELETVGAYDFGGKLTTPMTAHPKVDPVTGELHFFGYDAAPFITYHVATADGRLIHTQRIPVTGPTMMHDFAITEHHVVWLDMPVIFDMEVAKQGKFPYRWDDAYPPRIGILPRSTPGSAVKWFSIKPGYAFHVANAYEDADGRIVLDAINYDRMAFNSLWGALGGVSVLTGADANAAATGGTLYQWVIDPAKDSVSERVVDDFEIEFPTINPVRNGRQHRYVYCANTQLLTHRTGPKYLRYDLKTGARVMHSLDAGWIPGEATFVQAKNASAEDDGWLLTLITREHEDAAQLLVLDASDIAGKPVATIKLPRRVPIGFHGTWVPDALQR